MQESPKKSTLHFGSGTGGWRFGSGTGGWRRRPPESVETSNGYSWAGRRSATLTFRRFERSFQNRFASGSNSLSVPGKISKLERKESQRGFSSAWQTNARSPIAVNRMALSNLFLSGLAGKGFPAQDSVPVLALGRGDGLIPSGKGSIDGEHMGLESLAVSTCGNILHQRHSETKGHMAGSGRIESGSMRSNSRKSSARAGQAGVWMEAYSLINSMRWNNPDLSA